MKPLIQLILMSFFCIGICTVWDNSAYSQNIFYSVEQKHDFRNGDYEVVGKVGPYIYTYATTKQDYFLNAYNDSMALMAKVALDFFPLNVARTRFVKYPNHIIVLYQAVQRNHLILYAAFLNERGMLKDSPVALDSNKTTLLGHPKGYFSAVVSPNKENIMVYFLHKGDLRTTLLDKKLHILHHGAHKVQMSGQEDINQTLLDNTGRFYVTLAQKAGSHHYGRDFYIYQLSPDGRQMSHRKLSTGSHFNSGMYSKINKNTGLIYCAGFYTNRKNGNLNGVVEFHYNPDSKQFSKIKRISFSEELLQKAQNNSKAKKAFNYYKVRNLIIKNNGGFLIIAEKTVIRQRTETPPGGWGYYSWYYAPVTPNRTIKEYRYGDIVALNFDSSGHLSWSRFIRKNQYSQEDGGIFSSYAFLNSGASLVFLFNNFTTKYTKVEVAVLNASGKLQVQSLNVGAAGQSDWLPRQGVQIAKRAIVLPILNRNRLYFAKVAF